jgi:hypothetical protein
MKLYLVKHKGSATRQENLMAWSDVEELKNGIYVKSVQAFLRKKHAQEHIDEHPDDKPTEYTRKEYEEDNF